MEGTWIPAARAEGPRGARAEGHWAGSHTTHLHRGAAGAGQPLEKVEQPGNKREWKKGKNQKQRVVKHTKPETEIQKDEFNGRQRT